MTINTGHTITIPNGQTMQAGTLFNKGTLQNLGTLQMGTLAGNNAGTLQSVDYSYHIRGGLRGINLDANNNPSLAGGRLFSMKLGYEEDNVHFDGNISSQKWLSATDNLSRNYAYFYDGASRILGANFSGGKSNENYSLENMSYDANGNILSLSRKGKTGVNSWGYIDQLSYVYEANSNKIKKVSDLQGLSNQNVGDFRDSSNVAIEYEYWQDGSLKIDRNKKISQVDYNYLKLPRQITFEGGQWIKNQYDASGKKLKSTTSDGIIYDYVGNKIYKNGTLYQISQDEGRIINGNYEYDVKDHLGNLRVSFRDSSGIAKIVTKLDYDPWGLILKGLDYSNPTINKNNFQFGSKEKVETFGLNWIDFGARQYMPDVPHFTTVNPLAEEMRRWSPYSYAFCNPLRFIDPDGMKPGDLYDQKANKIGTDNVNDGKVYVVTDKQTVKDLKKSGGTVANAGAVNSAIELPSASVRTEMGKAVDRAESPSGNDLKGGFHEEGGIFGEGANGQETVINAKPGAYSDPSVDAKAEVDVFSGETSNNYLNTTKGTLHTHPSGSVIKGSSTFSFGQEPSNLNGTGDIPNAQGKPYNSYVLSPGVNKVFIYGTIYYLAECFVFPIFTP